MQKLGLGQSFAVFFAVDEPRQDVDIAITRMIAALVDQRLQVREHFRDRAVSCFRSPGRQHRLERAEYRERPTA